MSDVKLFSTAKTKNSPPNSNRECGVCRRTKVTNSPRNIVIYAIRFSRSMNNRKWRQRPTATLIFSVITKKITARAPTFYDARRKNRRTARIFLGRSAGRRFRRFRIFRRSLDAVLFTDYVPLEIHVPVDFEDREILEKILTERRGRRVYIHEPKRGQKARNDLARRNKCENRF